MALQRKADILVVGAGVAGVAAAHYLATAKGAKVILADQRPPLSHTSALSTECYRAYWANSKPMTAMMHRSIDLLEERARECDNAFHMSRRGYWFVTATEQGANHQRKMAQEVGLLGYGDARVYDHGDHSVRYTADTPYDAVTDALTVFQGSAAISAFMANLPQFLTAEATSLMHVGRAGWMSAQQMGEHLLQRARAAGAETLTPASLAAVHATDGAIGGATLVGARGEEIEVRCGAIVNCAGPYAASVDLLMRRAASDRATPDDGLPLENEVHAKAVLRDADGAVPDEAPMTIWQDDVQLEWSADEAAALREEGGFEASLAEPLAAGAHFRPYPGRPHSLLMLWEALHSDLRPAEPPDETPALRGALYAELAVRGLSRMVPALRGYLQDDGSMSAHISVDGGYYTKAPDNVPLVGPVVGAPAGSYVCAGLSGYGIMASNAAGELLAQHVAGDALPEAYAPALHPERWHTAAYQSMVREGKVEKGVQI